MEQKIIEKFATQFKPVDKKVKEEELLLFLDKRTLEKFDRETFLELRGRVQDRGLELTPLNFARIYAQAYELMELKDTRTTSELNNVDKMARLVKGSRSAILRITFFDVYLDNYSDSSNYLQFEVSKDFAVNIYNFTTESTAYLYIPEDRFAAAPQVNISLFSSTGKLVDKKIILLPSRTESQIGEKLDKIKFNDGSILSIRMETNETNPTEVNAALTQRKTEMQNYQIFVRGKRALLADTFKEVFDGYKLPSNVRAGCSTTLIISAVLTAIMFGLALFLNFTRCMFIDISVAISFFGNMYIWRNFNLFLGLKLILALVASVLLDISWEVMRLVHINSKVEEVHKSLRVKGLIVNCVNIVVKLGIMLFYYRLSNENQSHGFLAINDEVSINEVNEEEYLMKLPNYDDKVFN